MTVDRNGKTRPVVNRIDRAEAYDLEVAPWDRIARTRARDLDSGKDLSYRHVIRPHISQMIRQSSPESVIDIGCGVGRLTAEIAKYAGSVVGIDPSAISADLARSHLSDKRNVEVLTATARTYKNLNAGRQFDAAVLSMVLQDVVDLTDILVDTAALVRTGGSVSIVVTHPFFWPKYWGYDRAPWFTYEREMFLRTEFRTSLTASGVETMHCHRPLESYVSSLTSSGFRIEEFLEPSMPPDVQRETGVHWSEPHFLFIRCTRDRAPLQ